MSKGSRNNISTAKMRLAAKQEQYDKSSQQFKWTLNESVGANDIKIPDDQACVDKKKRHDNPISHMFSYFISVLLPAIVLTAIAYALSMYFRTPIVFLILYTVLGAFLGSIDKNKVEIIKSSGAGILLFLFHAILLMPIILGLTDGGVRFTLSFLMPFILVTLILNKLFLRREVSKI